jgi:hypothetical protein
MRAVVFSSLALSVIIGAGQVWGQSGIPGGELRRNVPYDTEARVSSAARWLDRHGICTTSYMPPLELVSPPKHGTVRFVTALIPAPRGSGCDSSIPGTVVLYRPNSGFVGGDQFTYNSPADPMTIEQVGPRGPITINVTVAPPAPTTAVPPETNRYGLPPACYHDADTICGDVQRGGGRIVACLRRNATRVSAVCATAISIAPTPIPQASASPTAPAVPPNERQPVGR